MPMPFIDHFAGIEGQTCSYTTDFISKNAKAAKEVGMSEADYRKHLVQGHYGYLRAQLEDPWVGGLKDGQILFRGTHKSTGIESTFAWNAKTSKVVRSSKSKGKELMAVDMEFDHLKFYLDGDLWDMRIPTHRKSPVSLSSNSVGALTDEDAAILFVKVKDEFAKAKGVNIKGANPQLDAEVYESIAKKTGYSANEIRLKVEAYKASGKKLSALKKKALAGKANVKTPDPVPPPPPAVKPKADEPAPKVDASWLEDAKEIKGEKVTTIPQTFGAGENALYKGHKIGSIVKAEDFAGKGYYDVKFKDPNGLLSAPTAFETKEDALKTLQEYAEKKFADIAPLVKPPPVHVASSKPAVADIVDDMKDKDQQKALVYKDEDVVKAYIKAKDQLAGDGSNKWTLYTQSDEFENAIFSAMDKFHSIDLSPSDIKKAIANYLGTGQKISVLKKKMIKSGEFTPSADTLKKTKAEKQFGTPATTSVKEAQDQINDMTSTAEIPVGAAERYAFSSVEELFVFDELKNGIYAAMQPQSAWEKFFQVAHSWQEKNPGSKVSALDIMRIYDRKKAAQLGITNGNFYEKKVAEWAATPAGQSHIITKKNALVKEAEAKKKAEELLKNQPPLPEDSNGFKEVGLSEAVQRQNSEPPWNAREKSGLRTYTGSSYREMNSYLRGTTSHISSGIKESMKAAQDGMRPTSYNWLTHRGCSWRQFGFGSEAEALSMVGKVVQDKGFLSTSAGSRAAFGGDVRLDVEIPRGTHGAYVDHISMNAGENEFIVAAGTQYQVLQVIPRQGFTPTIIRIRAIPGSHTKDLS